MARGTSHMVGVQKITAGEKKNQKILLPQVF